VATLPSFRTWTAGEVVTAAFFNSNVRDAGNFFLSWPVAELRQTVAQSLATGASTAVTMDTEDVDTDNGHSTVTNTSRYTGQTAGRFQCSGKVGFAANAAGVRVVWLSKSGTAINGSGVEEITNTVAAAVTLLPTATMTTFLNGSTDYLEVFALQTSGGALNTDVTTFDQSILSVRMVGST
jgi:hypothetical protein